MDIVSWVNLVEVLIDVQEVISLEELTDKYASILPREYKCDRLFV